MALLARNPKNAKLFREMLESSTSTPSPVTRTFPSVSHDEDECPEQIRPPPLRLRRPSHGDVPGEALNIWNRSPRTPRTPVRERTPPVLPPLVEPRGGSQFVVGDVDPALSTSTPCPRPCKKRLPALNLEFGSMEPFVIHAGVSSGELEGKGDSEDIL